jgi:DNA-binding NtrC family response regulator
VVDDDETIRKALVALFTKRYAVTAYGSAKEGVAAIHDEVCTVILDVRMKGFDGFWACNEIRKTYPDLPVIFYSAYQDVKNPFDIINEHRPFGYLTKDGDHQRLVKAVEMAVRLYQLTLQNKRLVASLKRDRKPGA